ncbi:MAG: ATP-binding protein [Lachnospiraceae bacterium]|nr:ATP-binding protein [Lachnospiraceae bacterium]
MKRLETGAVRDNLSKVLAFVDSTLEDVDCPLKTLYQIDIAVEEIFVNIASYAYSPGTGKAVIEIETEAEPGCVAITFRDSGIPYDPLAKEDPDITLCAEEREIGGLGIFMVKKSMDDVKYEYSGGQNILTIRKNLKG